MNIEECFQLLIVYEWSFHFLLDECLYFYWLCVHQIPWPSLTNIYLFKVNNRNTRKRIEISSKLTIKTSKHCHWCLYGVFIVNFKHFATFFLKFLLLTLRMRLFAGSELGLQIKRVFVRFFLINFFSLFGVWRFALLPWLLSIGDRVSNLISVFYSSISFFLGLESCFIFELIYDGNLSQVGQ